MILLKGSRKSPGGGFTRKFSMGHTKLHWLENQNLTSLNASVHAIKIKRDVFSVTQSVRIRRNFWIFFHKSNGPSIKIAVRHCANCVYEISRSSYLTLTYSYFNFLCSIQNLRVTQIQPVRCSSSGTAERQKLAGTTERTLPESKISNIFLVGRSAIYFIHQAC